MANSRSTMAQPQHDGKQPQHNGKQPPKGSEHSGKPLPPKA
ncbi:hypothetical protein RBI21_14795 [Klebsiella pneumoniae]|nr:hypothetical protein RBI21_14795 [Klebsiella pneumoniae]